MATISCKHPVKADHPYLYELLVSELTDFVVFLTDPNGCIASWNPGVQRILGYTEEEWIGQSAEILFTPEDRSQDQAQKEMKTALRDGRAADVRWHMRKDGSRFYVEGTMVALRDNGHLLGFSKVMRDVTERQKRELELQDAVAYAESIINAMREPLLVLDAELRVRSANRSFYQMFQVSPETIKNQFLYELGHGQWNISPLRALLENVLPRQAAVEDFKVEHQFPHVGRKTMLFNARKLWREGNHTELILLVMEDITERHEAEQERERLTRELKLSNEDLTQFAHMAAHDLQSPLRGVASFAQLLSRRAGTKLDSQEQEWIGYIVDNARRMGELAQLPQLKR